MSTALTTNASQGWKDQRGRQPTSPLPTEAFTVLSPYSWNLSKLYTTGEVTLTAASGPGNGDFNGDGIVDASDLVRWQAGFGTSANSTRAQGDADGDLDVDGNDFLVWQGQVGSSLVVVRSGAVPEPAALMLIVLAAAGASTR